MFLYKGINTMDSMVGYKNDKYLNFGRYAARLDDIANYIPARISAWLMILASLCAGFDWKNAKKIFLRDATIMQALILPRQRQSWQVRWISSLREMHFISGNYMKNQPSEMRSGKWRYKDIPRANRLLYVSAALGTLFFALIRMGIFCYCKEKINDKLPHPWR